jgi:hypothetical protein
MMLWSAKHDPQTEATSVLIAELKRDRARAIRKKGGIEAFLSSRAVHAPTVP